MAGVLPGSKSNIEVKIATDDAIFKRLNKKINRLDQPIGKTPNIQNQGDLIKPDGTIAQNDDDVRLIQGIPLRTPSGILEYKEELPNENFPLKVPLTVQKYDIESFMEAVDTNFSFFLSGYNDEPLHIPDFNVLDGPQLSPEKEVELVNVPETEREAEEGEEVTYKSAAEEFGEDVKFLTEINSAGNLTGVGGTIWFVWRGFKYRFHNGNQTNVIDNSTKMTTNDAGPVDQNTAIKGLTNTKDGRNLEVTLKDRDKSYNDVEIVPAADITAVRSISALMSHLGEDEFDEEEIQWNRAADGWEYNTNEIIVPAGVCNADAPIRYEPGDLIKPSPKTESGYNVRVFLPNQRNRWTEYHPAETQKPMKASQVYMPSGDEVLTKEWEGRMLRGYNGGISKGYYMIQRGEMKKTSSTVFQLHNLLKDLPLQNNEDGNNWSNYHGVSYVIMDWNDIRKLGYPDDKKLKKEPRDPNAKVKLSQHGDDTGWKRYFGKGSFNTSTSPSIPNDATSFISVPEGLQVTVYQHSGYNGQKKTIRGPWTDSLRDWWNDQISSIKVADAPVAMNAGGGYVNSGKYKEYLAEGDYYKKPHLAPYNELFD